MTEKTANAAQTFEHVCEVIKKEKLVKDKMHVIIGLSGGPDSMCLFDMFCRLAEPMQLTLHPVHVNHKFRPGAAERDQDFVEAFCLQRGWPCGSFVYHCTEIAEKEGMTAEEAGRKVRYEAFGKTAAKLMEEGLEEDRIAIAVAQNANDQAETILFRILRGTGTDGIAGIAKKRYEQVETQTKGIRRIPVIRPLLETTRADIEQYLAQRKIPARIDHTNEETTYTRNKIRLQLLPYLAEHYNQNVLAAVNRLGQIAETDRDYLRQQAEKAFQAALAGSDRDTEENETFEDGRAGIGEISLSIRCLEEMHPAIRSRVYQRALGSIGMRENFSSAQLAAIEKIRVSESPSAEADLADGFRAARVYDILRFYHRDPRLPSQANGAAGEKATSEAGRAAEETAANEANGAAGEKATSEVRREAEAAAANEAAGAAEDGYRLWRIGTAEYRNLLKDGRLGRHGAFRAAELPEGARPEVRTRRDGDVLAIKGGTKKLQDFFVDEKVPKNCRDTMKVLACGNQILWVLPSENFKSRTLRQKGRFCADRKVDFEREETIIILEISSIL